MMFDLPGDDTLYAALMARDAAYDGRAFVAVRATGVFCRLTCPRPKPAQAGCAFHDSFLSCLEAGLRPCEHCHPLGDDPLVTGLIAARQADPARRWREGGLTAGDPDPSAVLWADWIATPLGPMVAVADTHALHLLEFPERKALPRELDRLRNMCGGPIGFGRPAPIGQAARDLARYFDGTSPGFETRLAPRGTVFQQAVWAELRRIPAGQTRSYSELARALGRPSATRAVAAANGANPIAILIPCHRVLGADGALTGYGGGLWRKQRLIEIEQRHFSEGETP
ncbi:methylated-DNA--[protein]-cysteine S-methyltransferase [Aliiroseovarius sp.]|uniref:methylated-DNA--[protein]-cysteine S-methyltransferase n=1 Tax=Aliiroseovarius sp. TaxID=1872442 RepID=UPI002637C459|nr:methylated-DNA--[protein]-cysteine S-methyltransferase [Aliiroseovarius sp.]